MNGFGNAVLTVKPPQKVRFDASAEDSLSKTEKLAKTQMPEFASQICDPVVWSPCIGSNQVSEQAVLTSKWTGFVREAVQGNHRCD
jgi:hypothetical protein